MTSLMDQALSTSQVPSLNSAYREEFEFFYPTAQNSCILAEETYNDISTEKVETMLDAWSWGFGDYATEEISCWAESFQYLLRLMQTEGSFVGIIGFSTGASTALALASIAERGACPDIMQIFQLDPNVSPASLRQSFLFD
jgi:hypothetical protein